MLKRFSSSCCVLALVLALQISCYKQAVPSDVFNNFKDEIHQAVKEQCLVDNPGVEPERCNLRKCISPPYILIGMDILLHDVDKFLKRHGVQYWLEGASVLGGLRFDAYVPWDDDVDLQVIANTFPTDKIRQEVEANGYLFVQYPKNVKEAPQFWQIFFTPKKLRSELSKYDVIPKEWIEDIADQYQRQKDPAPHLDIFLMADDKTHVAYESWGHPVRWPRNTIFNPGLGELRMIDTNFPAPHNALAFAKLYYNTPNIITEAYFSTAHNPDCEKGVLLKNLKNYPLLLEYFENYLRFVFGKRFTKIPDALK